MLSIHNNLSAGAQNITGAYVIIMLVNKALTWQSSCVIANNARKTAKAVQGYNLEVYNVIKSRGPKQSGNLVGCIGNL